MIARTFKKYLKTYVRFAKHKTSTSLNTQGFRAYAIDEQGWVYICGNNLQHYSADKKPSVRACFLKPPPSNDGEYWATAGTDAWISYSKAKKQELFICD